MRLHTLDVPRFRDDYSFSGRGRHKYLRSYTDGKGIVQQETPRPVEGAPVGPGEPRG